MKRAVIILLMLLVCIPSSLFSATKEKNFTVSFTKKGISDVAICGMVEGSTTEIDKNNHPDRLDFSIWNGNTTPYANFGIVWNVYSGSSYKVTMSCYAFDGSKEHNMVYNGTVGSDEDPYLDYEVVEISGTVDNVDFNRDTTAGGVDFIVYEGTRSPYAAVSGEALVHLELERQEEYLGDKYIGYIFVELIID